LGASFIAGLQPDAGAGAGCFSGRWELIVGKALFYSATRLRVALIKLRYWYAHLIQNLGEFPSKIANFLSGF